MLDADTAKHSPGVDAIILVILAILGTQGTDKNSSGLY
jgi:hypothetical protein